MGPSQEQSINYALCQSQDFTCNITWLSPSGVESETSEHMREGWCLSALYQLKRQKKQPIVMLWMWIA